MTRLQTFSMVLWAPPVKASEDDNVERVLRVVNVLRDFDPAVAPAYERAWRKQAAVPFDYTPERVRELIRKNISREGRRVFPELGSVFGFFSSMDDDRMAGIGFSVGVEKEPFVNSFVLDFPIEPSVLHQEPPFTVERLWHLFKQCISAFAPHYGALANNVNWDRFPDVRRDPKDRRPVTVHWMNFFNPMVVKAIGRRRFETLQNVHLEEFQGGILLRLLDVPLDDSNPEHLERQREVNRRLGLPGA